MRRRETTFCVLSLLTAPTVPVAQTPRPMRRIGYLHSRTIARNHSTLVILSQAWQQLGYVEGETVFLRSAEGDARRLPALTAELIALDVGVLIVVGAAAIMATSQITRTTPIVGIDLGIDPVRAGLAASLARPGSNVTGLFLNQPAIVGKWVDLLREVAPDIERLAFLSDIGTGDQLEVAKAVARARGFQVAVLEVGTISSFDAALRGLSGRPRAGIAQLSVSTFTGAAAADFAAATHKYQLPAIVSAKSWMTPAGALMSYGPIVELYFPRAVRLADRILRGDKAGELPIEGPDRFELVIDLRVAKVLALSIPQSLLLRADELIQ